jgi:hypothetical protein
VQDVVAWTARDYVIAGTAADCIGAVLATEVIITFVAVNDVVPTAAADRVSARAARQSVRSIAALDVIITAAARYFCRRDEGEAACLERDHVISIVSIGQYSGDAVMLSLRICPATRRSIV